MTTTRHHRFERAVPVWLGSALLSLVFAPAVAATLLPRLTNSLATARSAAVRPHAVAGCPNYNGLLDSVIVPVQQPLTLYVELSSPAPTTAVFQVTSDDASIVVAGDATQGFAPTVTIPAGAGFSNAFTLYGIKVGQTVLRLTPLTPGYGASATPLGAWDINESGSGADQKFLDANDAAQSCRVPGTGQLANSAATQAVCGAPVQGVAADGVNPILLRTVSGLQGTACFELLGDAKPFPGTIQTPLIGTTPVSGLNYGFSYYTPPAWYGDTTDSRRATVEFTFTPSIGNGNTSKVQFPLTIVRPPVVLVHGVWSNGSTWNDNYRKNDANHTTQVADYTATHAAAFSTNASVVKDAVASALTLSRRKGNAATQADVIGHSMGGILTRLHVSAADFDSPESLGMGDVHRLITLDTPHWGSSFANLLVSLHASGSKVASYLETVVTGLVDGSMTQGAVCDLAENSPGIAGMSGGSPIAGQVITATGGPAGTPKAPALYWEGATFLHFRSFEGALTQQYCTSYSFDSEGEPVCDATAYYFPQNLVDAFRFQQANDAVVSLSSQQGGLSGTNYPAYIHFHTSSRAIIQQGVTDGADVGVQAYSLLDADPSTLAPSFPGAKSNSSGAPFVGGTPHDATDYANQCGAGKPMRPSLRSASFAVTQRVAAPAASPAVRIVSPAAGTLYANADSITVDIELSAPLTAANTVGVTLSSGGHLQATHASGLHFTASLPALPFMTGALTLTPDVTDTGGNVTIGAPVLVGIAPPSTPVSLAFTQATVDVKPGAAPLQLYPRGMLNDGTSVDLHAAVLGTTYTSSNPAVVTVGSDGLATILAAGRAAVIARSGSLKAAATFVVEDATAPLPAQSIGSQLTITRSGLRLDRTTGFYVQTVTVANNSGQPFAGPLFLVVSGLGGNVTLVSKSGLTKHVAPLGNAYVRLKLPGDGLTLVPGTSLQFNLQFLNPARAAIAYTVDVVASTLAP